MSFRLYGNIHHVGNKPDIHYNDVIIGAMATQITSLTIVTQPFIQAQMKENIKAPHHWPYCSNSSALAMALLQSFSKLLMYNFMFSKIKFRITCVWILSYPVSGPRWIPPTEG